MADYREISQQYAQGGIKSVILINAGAAVALLSQSAALAEGPLASALVCPMLLWAMGTALGASTWVLAFLSTRHVDRNEIATADKYMYWGLATIAASLLTFVLGCILLARALGQV